MKKDFIPYEQALALKGLGFGEPCYGWFDTGYLRFGCYESEHVTGLGDLPAPLYQQAFRWFREKYRLNSETPYLPNIEKYGIVVSDMTIKPKDLSKNENFKRGVEITNNFAQYDTHEEAELACLKKLIELSTKTA
jgi:hypothetical protein